MPARQYLLESIGIGPLAEGEPVAGAPRSQDARWAANLVAAAQFHTREGHLRPARKHVEVVDGESFKLGAFLDNTRRRVGRLSTERRAQLAQRLHADKAYDIPHLRKWLRGKRIGVRIARKGIESGERLGRRRWVIERTMSWLSGYRRLSPRYERNPRNYLAFLGLAAALCCYRRLLKLTM